MYAFLYSYPYVGLLSSLLPLSYIAKKNPKFLINFCNEATRDKGGRSRYRQFRHFNIFDWSTAQPGRSVEKIYHSLCKELCTAQSWNFKNVSGGYFLLAQWDVIKWICHPLYRRPWWLNPIESEAEEGSWFGTGYLVRFIEILKMLKVYPYDGLERRLQEIIFN